MIRTPSRDKALKLALEALEDAHQNVNPERSYADELQQQIGAAITAIREALAEQDDPDLQDKDPELVEPPAQQQEHVAWGVDWGHHGDRSCVSIVKKHPNGTIEVVATEYDTKESPPQRKPLTDEEIKNIWGSYFSRGIEFARAIEAAHGITGEQK